MFYVFTKCKEGLISDFISINCKDLYYNLFCKFGFKSLKDLLRSRNEKSEYYDEIKILFRCLEICQKIAKNKNWFYNFLETFNDSNRSKDDENDDLNRVLSVINNHKFETIYKYYADEICYYSYQNKAIERKDFYICLDNKTINSRLEILDKKIDLLLKTKGFNKTFAYKIHGDEKIIIFTKRFKGVKIDSKFFKNDEEISGLNQQQFIKITINNTAKSVNVLSIYEGISRDIMVLIAHNIFSQKHVTKKTNRKFYNFYLIDQAIKNNQNIFSDVSYQEVKKIEILSCELYNKNLDRKEGNLIYESPYLQKMLQTDCYVSKVKIKIFFTDDTCTNLILRHNKTIGLTSFITNNRKNDIEKCLTNIGIISDKIYHKNLVNFIRENMKKSSFYFSKYQLKNYCTDINIIDNNSFFTKTGKSKQPLLCHDCGNMVTIINDKYFCRECSMNLEMASNEEYHISIETIIYTIQNKLSNLLNHPNIYQQIPGLKAITRVLIDNEYYDLYLNISEKIDKKYLANVDKKIIIFTLSEDNFHLFLNDRKHSNYRIILLWDYINQDFNLDFDIKGIIENNLDKKILKYMKNMLKEGDSKEKVISKAADYYKQSKRNVEILWKENIPLNYKKPGRRG